MDAIELVDANTHVRLVGLVEAGRMLAVGRTTVYRLLRDDQLEGVKIGRRQLVTVESIDAYIARLRRRGDPRLTVREAA